MRRPIIALLVGALALVAGVPAGPAGPAAAAPGISRSRAITVAPGDLRVVSETRVSERVRDITFVTPALTHPVPVRIVLPAGFDPAAATRYPVLYLLHGGAGNYTNWSTGGHIEALTAELPLITVLPEAGRSAWYTDWFNGGRQGPPMWETFHIGQLIPWIDAHFPTVAARGGRAITGLSSGGFGAMSYAGRHPDLFAAAAAFSGALDTNTPPIVAGKVIDALALQNAGGPGALFGLRELHEVRWRGHNPWDLAGNLRDMSLTVRTGNGAAGGPFGGGGVTDPAGSGLERAVHMQSVSFHDRLVALGVPHEWDDYGAGTHNYNYWRWSLQRTLPTFMQVFAEHRVAPSPFSFTTIEPTYSVYDWTVSVARRALEFSSLERVSAAGFRVVGSGTATVTTASLYESGRAYRVAVGPAITTLVADAAGRLRIVVPLGPANATQQRYLPDGSAPLTKVRSMSVAVAPA